MPVGLVATPFMLYDMNHATRYREQQSQDAENLEKIRKSQQKIIDKPEKERLAIVQENCKVSI